MENISKTTIKQIFPSIIVCFLSIYSKSKLDHTNFPAQRENRPCDHAPEIGVAKSEWTYTSASLHTSSCHGAQLNTTAACLPLLCLSSKQITTFDMHDDKHFCLASFDTKVTSVSSCHSQLVQQFIIPQSDNTKQQLPR